VHQGYARRARRLPQEQRELAVQPRGFGRFVFGLVDLGVGHGVEQDRGPGPAEKGLHGRAVEDVEVLAAQGVHVPAPAGHGQAQGLPQEPGLAAQDDGALHACLALYHESMNWR
jgi:hypothetical protein